MAEEQENIKLQFDSNAKIVAGDVNKLGASIESTTQSTNENNQAVEQGEQSYKTFKTQLREANQELQKSIQLYGETSAETVKAAKAVADLKDQMGFAKDLSDSFNPDQKMKALGAATQVAGTGLQGVTAGMALFGGESEDTQKQLLKVQAAMAFSDAISNLSNIGDQFSILKTTVTDVWRSLTTVKAVDSAATAVNTGAVVANTGAVVAETTAITGATVATTAATIATNIFNASMAIALAPITLIVAGIAALVLGIGYLTGAFGDFSGEQLKAEVANKKLSNSIDAQEKAFKKNNEQLELSQSRAIGLAKAQGKSVDQIHKLENALINQEVAEKRLNAVKLQSIFIEASRIAGLEDATEAQKKTAEKAWESFKKANENYNDSLKQRKVLAINHEIEMATEKKQADDKAEEKAKERREKAREERKKEIQKQIDEDKKVEDARIAKVLQSEKDAAAILDELKKNNETPAQKEQREYDEKKSILEANNLSIEELKRQHLIKIAEIEKTEEEKRADAKKEADDRAAERKRQVDDIIVELETLKQNSLKDITDKGIVFLNVIAGKNKIIQKAAIISEGIVSISRSIRNTTEGNAGALAKSILALGPIVGPPAAAPAITMNTVSGGLSVATTVAQTAKALQALGGGGGVSGGSVPSVGGGATTAPPTVAFNNTAENQIGQSVARTQAEQPPLQVIVAESDITNAQNNVKVLENKNKF